jgi:hypothetical protein
MLAAESRHSEQVATNGGSASAVAHNIPSAEHGDWTFVVDLALVRHVGGHPRPRPKHAQRLQAHAPTSGERGRELRAFEGVERGVVVPEADERDACRLGRRHTAAPERCRERDMGVAQTGDAVDAARVAHRRDHVAEPDIGDVNGSDHGRTPCSTYSPGSHRPSAASASEEVTPTG